MVSDGLESGARSTEMFTLAAVRDVGRVDELRRIRHRSARRRRSGDGRGSRLRAGKARARVRSCSSRPAPRRRPGRRTYRPRASGRRRSSRSPATWPTVCQVPAAPVLRWTTYAGDARGRRRRPRQVDRALGSRRRGQRGGRQRRLRTRRAGWSTQRRSSWRIETTSVPLIGPACQRVAGQIDRRGTGAGATTIVRRACGGELRA